jgi:hypothetical protein
MALLTSSTNIGAALAYQYPNSQTIRDHIVRFDPDTQMFILETWNLTDPIPTEQQIEQWYLEYMRQQKHNELAAARDAAIFSPFQSSALGQPYTYTADHEARVRYNAILTRFMNDPSFTTASIYTHEAGFLPHNKQQFIQMWDDGMAHEQAQWDKYNQLIAQLNESTTVDQINSITW